MLIWLETVLISERYIIFHYIEKLNKEIITFGKIEIDKNANFTIPYTLLTETGQILMQ